MRVLLISHTCQSRTEGQPKAHALATFKDMTLRVLVPERWRRYGNWRTAERPANGEFDFRAERTRMTWAGPAQSYLHNYPCLRGMMQEFQPDVIDLWEEPWSMVSVQTCRLREVFLPKAKIVSETEQNIDKKLPFPFELFRGFTLRRADYVVGRSAEAVKIIRKKGYAGPAEVVPNAVDADLFRPMDRAACRRELGLSGFVAGYAGRMVEEKGLVDLIDALSLGPPQVNLVLVGDGPLKPWLVQQARVRKLENRLRILDAQPLAKLPPLMNALDVFILASRTTRSWKEQFGRVVIEAHACGTPVIGSNSGAIPDVIGGGGLVVPEHNAPALAAAITQLAGDPDRCRQLGQIGREQVLEHYTWQRVAERMYDIYQKLLSQPVLQK
jgi:glycosyltransferase involved in cell wall biosynthesis